MRYAQDIPTIADGFPVGLGCEVQVKDPRALDNAVLHAVPNRAQAVRLRYDAALLLWAARIHGGDR